MESISRKKIKCITHIHRSNFKYNSGDMGIPLHLLAEFHENQFKKTVIYKLYHFKRTTAL